MAQVVPNPPAQKNRVKVYELRDNDWFDLGTGFCSVSVVSVRLYISFLQRCNAALLLALRLLLQCVKKG
jgi:hypothetical protein